MRNDWSSSVEAAVLFKRGMRIRRWLVGWGAVGILAAVGLFGMAVTDARGEEQQPTPESIMKTNPDLYRAIQSGPPLPPPEVDPKAPYPPYPGFFAQGAVFKPGQIEEWWETSSFEYSPVYPYLLKHIHLKVTYAKSTGNDEGYAMKAGGLLAIRKGRFSNFIAYDVDRRSIVSHDGSTVDKERQGFEETAQYEFNRYLFGEVGFHWQRMSSFMIYNRFIPVVGLGSYNVLQDLLDKKRDQLRISFGFAQVKDEYYPDASNKIGKDSDSFKALYFRADFSHKFNPVLTFRSEFVLKHALDPTPVYVLTTIPRVPLLEQNVVVVGETKRYDWSFANSLEFALNQYVGFLISYTLNYDSNPWPIAVNRDTELMLGVKFAY